MSELDHNGSRWYISRKEIEENSPSRRDGIELKKEAKLRKSYCTFLQDLGMRLKVPQVTIATALVFCHRFFLNQSHAKNDWKTIGTVCMFLAGKVEETPRPLKDVIIVSHEIIHKRDPAVIQRIKQKKEVLEQQKELILLGERVVLTTLGFHLNVNHPYRSLVEAIKKFKVPENTLAQVAWNFVNDGMRTSLCLQYKPHHIAAGAIFLAAKFLKVKLPTEGEKHWWQEFDVTPRQLEDVSNQILELYDQNRPGQSSHANEGSASGASTNHAVMVSTISENSIVPNIKDIGVGNVKQAAQVPISSRPTGTIESSPITSQNSHNQHNNRTAFDAKGGILDEDLGVGGRKMEKREGKEEGSLIISFSGNGRSSSLREDAKVSCPPDAITKIDKDRVKAALEKQRKIRNDVVNKTVIVDEEDLIESELENGIVVGLDDEKLKQEKKHGSWSEPLSRQKPEDHCFRQAGAKDNISFRISKQQSSHGRIDPRSVYSEDLEDPEGKLSLADGHDAASLKFRDEDKTVCSRKRHGEMSHSEFRRLPRESTGTGPLDCIQRSSFDCELPTPELVNKRSLGIGRSWEGEGQHDFPHHLRESIGTARPDHPLTDHKRFRLHG